LIFTQKDTDATILINAIVNHFLSRNKLVLLATKNIVITSWF